MVSDACKSDAKLFQTAVQDMTVSCQISEISCPVFVDYCKKADISSGYYVLRPQFQQNYSLHMGLQPLGSTVNQFLL